MGNYIKGVNDELLLRAERNLFSLSGLDYDTFKISNVPIDEAGNYVRTFEIPALNLTGEKPPTLVLIHGYGGFAAIFYKIIKDIVGSGIHLIMIDIIGMGTSSRPEFNREQTSEEADAYFVEFIEKWRVGFGSLTDFYLAGHSFGGYISALYALKYKQNIKKLLMLSPVGVCIKPEGFDVKKLQKGRGPPTFIRKMFLSAWENKWSPFGLMRKTGSWGGKKMVNYYLNRRIGDALNDEEREHMATYMHQCFMREGSTEYALFICF
jgi:pimeloyl-ACP methyl ester carboxylesterase